MLHAPAAGVYPVERKRAVPVIALALEYAALLDSDGDIEGLLKALEPPWLKPTPPPSPDARHGSNAATRIGTNDSDIARHIEIPHSTDTPISRPPQPVFHMTS